MEDGCFTKHNNLILWFAGHLTYFCQDFLYSELIFPSFLNTSRGEKKVDRKVRIDLYKTGKSGV